MSGAFHLDGMIAGLMSKAPNDWIWIETSGIPRSYIIKVRNAVEMTIPFFQIFGLLEPFFTYEFDLES